MTSVVSFKPKYFTPGEIKQHPSQLDRVLDGPQNLFGNFREEKYLTNQVTVFTFQIKNILNQI
jgi:hypothetical protein